MRGVVLGCAVGIALLWAGTAGAIVTTVNCVHGNLQQKIDNVDPDSTLLIKGMCEGQFTINKSLKLVGNPNAILDGEKGGTVLTIIDGPVLLSHLKVTGGLLTGGTADGGGIYHSAGALTLRHVTVSGNRLHTTGVAGAIATGAGIFSSGESLVILHSLIENNIAKTTQSGSGVVAAGGIYRSGDMKIVDSTIRNNRAVTFPTGTNGLAQGGGVFLDSSAAPVIKGSIFSGNLARVSSTGGGVTAQGGGIYLNNGGLVDFEGSKFEANRASAETGGTSADARGGGIYADFDGGDFKRTKWLGNTTHGESTGDTTASGGGGTLISGLDFVLDRVRVSSNSTDSHGTNSSTAAGGGLEVQGLADVKVSTVDANTADAVEGGIRTATGGGLDITSGGLRMARSTVSRNEASAPGGQALGGGIRVEGGPSSSIRNSTVSANRVTGDTTRGGGIDSFASVLNVVNASVARNSAALGGGLYKETGTTTLEATILAANAASTGPNCGGSVETAGHNLISKKAGCTITPLSSDIVNKGAKLGTLGKHGGPTETISLLASSPAINAIPPAQCAVDKDQRAVKRPQGRRCDIGGFEVKH
jgi:hypothetical protein